ncbi:hypothetical protein C8Q80DRAFT_289397 [Daedaleopsis nitida]|nr:hypothetical protein C8Q80DRAFT_289397 [Daedaleopsis nitida]
MHGSCLEHTKGSGPPVSRDHQGSHPHSRLQSAALLRRDDCRRGGCAVRGNGGEGRRQNAQRASPARCSGPGTRLIIRLFKPASTCLDAMASTRDRGGANARGTVAGSDPRTQAGMSGPMREGRAPCWLRSRPPTRWSQESDPCETRRDVHRAGECLPHIAKGRESRERGRAGRSLQPRSGAPCRLVAPGACRHRTAGSPVCVAAACLTCRAGSASLLGLKLHRPRDLRQDDCLKKSGGREGAQCGKGNRAGRLQSFRRIRAARLQSSV